MHLRSLPAPLRRLAMRFWLASVGAARSHTIRPTDAPQVFAGGRDGLRILLAGSGPAAGWGVGSHDLALPGALARAVAATTQRGAVVDVVADASTGVRQLPRLLGTTDPSRYDVVVVSVTVTDALRRASPARWGRSASALVSALRAQGPTVAWLGSQPIRSIRPYDNAFGDLAQEFATRLDTEAERLCADTPGARFVPMPAPPRIRDARHRTPADYLFWARHIADAIVVLLDPDAPRAMHPEPADAEVGASRAQAIARLRLEERGPDNRLDALVGTARRTLGSDMALFTVLDASKEWQLASTGATLSEVPIDESVCLHTIAAKEGLFIADAREDARFASSPLVTGPAHLRFYAGYPVEAPDGTRIGAICVLGRTPRGRAEAETDLDVLRELALLAQRELWRWEPSPR